MSQYVTTKEFKSAPTGIDTSTLDQTAVGVVAAQDAMLTTVLRRASDWVDNICKVDTFNAASFTEIREMHATRDGRFVVFTRNTPIISLGSVKYKTAPQQVYSDVNLGTNVQSYSTWFTVYSLNNGMFLDTYYPQFYYSPYSLSRLSDTPIILTYTYTAGYFNSVIVGPVAAGATSITVANAAGLAVDSSFTISDGASTEYCVVSNVVGNVVTLANGLLFAHADKASAYAIPEPIKEATILLASFLIRERGSYSFTMTEAAVSGISSSYTKADDVDMAKQLLKPYIRLVTS